MNNNPSPLEYLASFAITFAIRMIASATLSSYTKYLRKRASTAK